MSTDARIPRLRHNVFENFEHGFNPEYCGLFDIPMSDAYNWESISSVLRLS